MLNCIIAAKMRHFQLRYELHISIAKKHCNAIVPELHRKRKKIGKMASSSRGIEVFGRVDLSKIFVLKN